jgi:hypothetical protein
VALVNPPYASRDELRRAVVGVIPGSSLTVRWRGSDGIERNEIYHGNRKGNQVMSYTVGWSGHRATVSTADEVEAVLDRIAADNRRWLLVHIAAEPDRGSLIEMVWGDPERAMLTYTDDDWGGRAVDLSMPLASGDLNFDQGSVEPDLTRLSAATARQAVVEFVTTGKRPTCITTWME